MASLFAALKQAQRAKRQVDELRGKRPYTSPIPKKLQKRRYK